MFILKNGKNGRFGRRFRHRYNATEALLDANGGTFALQRRLRCTPKVAQTDSKSATFES